MAMSVNSAESKISPQAWHSTNSASSSQETIFTMGCLQVAVMDGSWGVGWLDSAVVGPGCQPGKRRKCGIFGGFSENGGEDGRVGRLLAACGRGGGLESGDTVLV